MPLCVTLSAITSVVTVFSIPFLINLALQTFHDQGELASLPVFNMLRDLIGYTLLPLAAGMIIRGTFTEFAEKSVEPIRKSVLWLMVAVLVLGIVSSYQELLDNFAAAGALVLTMNVLTMALGFGLARAFRLPTPQVVTITFEVGVQNLALAFAITFTMLRRPDLAAAGLLYAVVMPATALAFISIGRRMIVTESAPATVGASKTAP